MARNRLTELDVACWVLKANPKTYDLRGALDAGVAIEGWTLHDTYRVDLMAPRQRCLLWLSGPDAPGVYAIGKILDYAVDNAHGGGPYWQDLAKSRRLVPAIPISVAAVRIPVPRRDLLADPRFVDSEVIKMAAGSNPSYLTAEQLDAVKSLLEPADLRRGGW